MAGTSEQSDKTEESDRLGDFALARYWQFHDDAMYTCPFDTSHQIRRYRVERHLYYCRKNHPDVKVAVCPFNASHVLPGKQFIEHVIGCPDVRIVDKDQGQSRTSWTGKTRNFKTSFGAGNPKEPQTNSELEMPKIKIAPLPTIPDEPVASPEVVSVDGGGNNTMPAQDSRPDSVGGKREGNDIMERNRIRTTTRFPEREEALDQYMKTNIIPGGVASLITCKGEAPIEEMEENFSDSALEQPISEDSESLSRKDCYLARVWAYRSFTRPTSAESFGTETSAPF